MAIVSKQVLAEQDLIDIWLYTWQEWGEKQADAYLDKLEKAMELLAEQPKIGNLRKEFTPPVRLFFHGHHFIVYQIIEGGISVIRVLHASMNIHTQLS